MPGGGCALPGLHIIFIHKLAHRPDKRSAIRPVYATRPFLLIIELTVVTTNIQTVAGIFLKVRRQSVN
ncbi:Uncharacterised protein [Salmonella enterica subsp. enterica serovar Typhimurium str. DT104]|nr:Uncharacterised protein [Salmonella enterica subsp. enterica serovar Typhimurium str. DT104]CNN57164.1 Uncharacterised protein [Salmonella enterica subsp. enterica serovar Typhimurium str. DT104]CNO28974.1 Uncharacterised protein [Salmonella enterica subsp. enterica serovar Typhimurium str. DT104]CNO32795.1 Uncharacterised protein [Salmonella enterica subsp. enterica serovar Typhimurium str. DT104]CNO35074.1 Uncharacterised protein [Salmonella enterica subsp. enterica serovar Typhimurium str